ncbi:MAG: family 78 glycoside hydrolase catalytic domain [Clostridia bacterium]|nr:family 78 glycoside hydrolase catalytic domain [Clostridia bacterium]
MSTSAFWLTARDFNDTDRQQPRLVYYRHSIYMESLPASFPIVISAVCRYKLFVNGKLVSFGPSKGDDKVWFTDEPDLAPCLVSGENIIAVQVLHYPDSTSAGNHSMFRFPEPCLYIGGLSGIIRTHICRDIQFIQEEAGFAPLWIHEHVAGGHLSSAWMMPGYNDSAWPEACIMENSGMPKVLKPECLIPRTIPFMERIQHTFALPCSEFAAGSTHTFVLDAGEEMCAFMRLSFSGGKGSTVQLLYSECYTHDGKKGNRLDALHGELAGYSDVFTVSGSESDLYCPFWFRTFRFIQVTIQTADEPFRLTGIDYEETGYPLKALTQVKTSDPSLERIWDISMRTLRRCMHDTYVDCPYYEQLQYVMDTRAEILYTYAVSADDRLARKAMDDFARSQRPDGLLNASYPNVTENVIPGFSMYYILMVHDHMMYFGDRALVQRYLPVIDRSLSFFDRNLTPEGLVGSVGGINGEAPFWSFIDWTDAWLPTTGMPPAGLAGPITMESLLYLLGLQKAAELAAFTDDAETAARYLTRADAIRAAVRRHCMNTDGFITDGPHNAQYSQHCQVFGTLTGVLTKEEGRQRLIETIRDKSIPQCTVAMCFYLFRALEMTGLYEYTDQYLNIWRRMIDNGCTTTIESEGYSRSECHAWGALILYELPSAVLGVHPGAPGYSTIEVCPNPGVLRYASGSVRTPNGPVQVAWTLTENGLKIHIDGDPDIKRRISIKTA